MAFGVLDRVQVYFPELVYIHRTRINNLLSVPILMSSDEKEKKEEKKVKKVKFYIQNIPVW